MLAGAPRRGNREGLWGVATARHTLAGMARSVLQAVLVC